MRNVRDASVALGRAASVEAAAESANYAAPLLIHAGSGSSFALVITRTIDAISLRHPRIPDRATYITGAPRAFVIGIFMLEEIADATLNKVKQFTVGFGRAGEEPAAKGSGVLVRHGELHGILTCAHVSNHLRDLKRPIGLVRLNRGPAEQLGTLNMEEVFSYVVGEEPWTSGEEDLAFIHLPPHLAANIGRDCVFLDAERNFIKPEPDELSSLIQVNSVFGLVEAFTGVTTRQVGRATTLLRGVMTPGTLRDLNPLSATLDCFEENLPDLPSSFGGTSGGGLWRVYVRKREDGGFEVVHHRLIGIASSEDKSTMPPRWIMCQGFGRIEALLREVLLQYGTPQGR
jgi:hypothetical protein